MCHSPLRHGLRLATPNTLVLWCWSTVSYFIQRQTCHKDSFPAIRHAPTCQVPTQAPGLNESQLFAVQTTSDLSWANGRILTTENGHEIWTLNVRCLCRSWLVKALATELAKYKLDFVVLEEFRLNKLGTEWAVNFSFSFENENDS